MSTFLTGLSNVAGAASDIGSIASGVGAVTGVVKGVGNLLGLGGNQQKQQYKYQKKLMEYQNQLNQQNSLLDYQRQRELTADNPMLQKIGLRNAGMNTAMGDGSTASAASVGSTSPSSTPSPLPTDAQVDSQYAGMINQSVSALGTLALQKAQIGLVDQQAKNQEIRNLTQLGRDMAEKGLMSSQAAKNFNEAAYQNIVNKYADSRLSAEANNAASIASINSAEAAVRGPMLKAQYDNAVQDLNNKIASGQLTKQQIETEKKKLDVMKAQINSLNASAADSLSHVGVNETQAVLNSTNTENVKSDTENKKEDNVTKKNENKLFKDTYSDRIATIRKGSVPDNLYQKIQLWRRDGTFEKLDGLQQAGYGIYESLQDIGLAPRDILQLLKFIK